MNIEEILKNKKIIVKPIVREGSWLGPGHDGEFMFGGALFSTDLAVDARKNQLIPILNRDEQKAFEKEMQLEDGAMSFYKKNSKFWTNFRVKLDKEGTTLNLADPVDYLKWLILKTDKRVAHSWDERFNSGEYKFALVDEDQEVKAVVSRAETASKAYRLFGKIEDSVSKMQDVLRVYGKKSKSTDKDFLRAEIQKLIDKNVKEFISILEDKNYTMKVFVEKALDARALERTPNKGYALIGGDEIGRTILEVIEYLENPRNQDVYLKLKAQIDNK